MWETNTDLSNTVFEPLRMWAEESTSNWNILVGIGFLLVVVGIILLYIFTKKIGREDERTSPIYLKSASIMLLVIVLLDIFFPKEYMWQIFFLFKYSIAFLLSGFYLAIRYNIDMKS